MPRRLVLEPDDTDSTFEEDSSTDVILRGNRDGLAINLGQPCLHFECYAGTDSRVILAPTRPPGDLSVGRICVKAFGMWICLWLKSGGSSAEFNA